MRVLHNFEGITVMPYCTTRRMESIWIDRVRVVAVRTLYKETLYYVEGSHGDKNSWAPVSRQFREVDAALDAADTLAARIEQARVDETAP